MIINKVLPYLTEENAQQRERIQQALDNLVPAFTQGDREQAVKRWQELISEEEDIIARAEERYIKAKSKKEILSDVKEIVDAIEKKDFLEYLKQRTTALANMRAEGRREETLSLLTAFTIENYDNCHYFIILQLRVQLNALADDEDGKNKVISIVSKRVSQWYIASKPAYLPMAYGKATDALAYINGKTALLDDITRTAKTEKDGVLTAIAKSAVKLASRGVSAHKLLVTALAVYTRQHDFRHIGEALTDEDRLVIFPLKEYGVLLDKDIQPHETGTEEEARQEKIRAKNNMDNFRKDTWKDLTLIQAYSSYWDETIKGKPNHYDSVSYVTRVNIKGGNILLWLTPELIRYLKERNTFTWLPLSLLKVKTPNAYRIGIKINEHYYIDFNQIIGTHDRLSVKELLAETDLQSYEEIQKTDRGHWEERLKDPLETYLEELVADGYLKEWKYTHAKGIDLTEEEAYSITSYATFSGLYIRFTLAETVDNTERIEAKREARAKALAEKKKQTTKKTTTKRKKGN